MPAARETEEPAAATLPPNRRFAARVLEFPIWTENDGEFPRIVAHPSPSNVATGNGRVFAVALHHVSQEGQARLEQELRRVEGDAGGSEAPNPPTPGRSDRLLLATWGQYRALLGALRAAPPGFEELADEIESALHHYTTNRPKTVHGAHRSVGVGPTTLVMGVVNVTPDSFSDGGKFHRPEAAVSHGRKLVEEGAAILDIGGESTRPSATPVDEAEEWARIGPVVRELARATKVPISVDTRHPEVARRAIEAGADIVNDVSGLTDPAMRRVVAETGAAAVVMHQRGTPRTMADLTHYADVRGEVYETLAAVTAAAEADGIAHDRLLIDPGLGFAKDAAQNLDLLSHVGELRSLGYPVLIGASRKSFLGAYGGGGTPADRDEASIGAAVVAALQGAHIVRSHEVARTVRALSVANAIGRGRFAASTP